MNIIKRMTLIAAAAICFAAVSCNKDNTIQYNNTTMGNVVDGAYVSDQGNIFHIAEQTCSGKIDTMKRALTVCDVLNKTEGGKDNEYDVRMNRILQVLVKDIAPAGTEVEEDVKVEHPVNIDQLWISGGYINMYITFPFNEANKAKHMINLVQQESKEAGTYELRLTHNAFEDALTPDSDIWQYKLSGGYVSFPINSFMKEDEAIIKISWKGFNTNNFVTTQDQTIQGRYKKDGFEHAPILTTAARVAIN